LTEDFSLLLRIVGIPLSLLAELAEPPPWLLATQIVFVAISGGLLLTSAAFELAAAVQRTDDTPAAA
jgi:hypothetical protein